MIYWSAAVFFIIFTCFLNLRHYKNAKMLTFCRTIYFQLLQVTLFEFKLAPVIFICNFYSYWSDISTFHLLPLMTTSTVLWLVTDKSCTGTSSKCQSHCFALWHTIFVKVVTCKDIHWILLRAPCGGVLIYSLISESPNKQIAIVNLWYMTCFVYVI